MLSTDGLTQRLETKQYNISNHEKENRCRKLENE